MLSKISPIWSSLTKGQLVKTIQTLRNPKIDILEVWDKTDKTPLTKQFDKMISKGHFSVIFLRSEK